MNKKYLKTYNCSQPLGNSSNMHEDIFARIVTFARGVTFLQKHFCTDGNICTKGHFWKRLKKNYNKNKQKLKKLTNK